MYRLSKVFLTMAAATAILFNQAVSAATECPYRPAKGGECWTTEDVIDNRIDHHAQSAMMSMFARGGAAEADASAILCAVKIGRLEGVYRNSMQVPALRAQPFGGWWTIIPKGQVSTCFKKPPERPPLIAFQKRIQKNRDFMAQALGNAWRNCAIPPTAPRCYVNTIDKPPEPAPAGKGKGSLEVRAFFKDIPGSPPAPGAIVNLSGPSDAGGFRTDSNGIVRIDGLASGTYGIHVNATPPGGLIPNAAGSASGQVAANKRTRVDIGLGTTSATTLEWSVEVVHPEPQYMSARTCPEIIGVPGSSKLCVQDATRAMAKDRSRIESQTKARLDAAVKQKQETIRRRELENPSVVKVEFLTDKRTFGWKVDKESADADGPEDGTMGTVNMAWILQGRGQAQGTYQLTFAK